MKKIMLLIMVIMGLPVAVNASNTGFDTSGFYIGISHGIGTVQGPSTRGSGYTLVTTTTGEILTSTCCYWVPSPVVRPGQQLKDKVNISEIHIGYDVSPFLSFELGYADYGSASKTFKTDYDPSPFDGSEVPEVREGKSFRAFDVNVFSLATLIKYPIYDNLSVYGLVSYDKVYVEEQWENHRYDVEQYNKLGYGAGIRWSFSENFAAKLQWKKISTLRARNERLNLSNTLLIFEMSL